MKSRRLHAAIPIFLVLLSISPAPLAQIRTQQGKQDQAQINNDIRTVASLIRVGEYSRAAGFLDRMRDIYGDDPRIDDLYKQVYKQAKLYPELERLIRQQLAGDPRNSLFLTELGEARFLQNDEAQADSLWNQALEVGRGNELAYRFVADAKLRYGLYDEAIGVFLRGRRNFGAASLFSMELAGIYEIQRDYPKAVDEYLIQILENPESVGFISTKIRGLVEDADDPESILETVSNKIRESPGQLGLYEIQGDLHIKLGQMDEALESYKTIGAKQNDDGESLIRFADRAFHSKAYSTAIKAVDEYFKVTKRGLMKDMASLIKARAQLASGLIDEALAGFKRLFSIAMDFRIKNESGFLSGKVYAEYKNDCDSALYYWRILLSDMKDPALMNQARLGMSVCFLKEDAFGSAESLLTIVASGKTIDPSFEEALFLLGDISFYKGEFSAASDRYKQLVRQYPQGNHSNDALMRMDVIATVGDDSSNFGSLAHFAEALKAMTLGDANAAAKTLADSALTNSPIAEQASYFSAISFFQASGGDQAITAFRAYINNYPDGLYIDRAYLGLGDLYARDESTLPDARAAYSRILEAFPEGPVTEVARQRLRMIEKPGRIG